MLKQRKIPMRMCVGCREMFPKKELMRVVKSPENVISFDRIGKAPGRGAYICRELSCLQAARKARRFEKAFSCKIPDEVYDKMEEELQDSE